LLCRNAAADTSFETARLAVPLPLTPALSTMVLRFAGRPHYVFPILFDHLSNFCRMQSRLWTDIGDSPTQADVVTYEIDAIRGLQQVVDVGLANTKASVDITTVVRFFAISHVLHSIRNQLSWCSTKPDASQGTGPESTNEQRRGRRLTGPLQANSSLTRRAARSGRAVCLLID
jgi:hypothetical protein